MKGNVEKIWKKFAHLEPNNEMNNGVCIIGEIVEDFTFNHATRGEMFYKTRICVKRESERMDYISVITKYGCTQGFFKGDHVKILGRISSFMHHAEGEKKNWLDLYVYAETIEKIQDTEMLSEQNQVNEVYLRGYICQPVRMTCNKKKKITEVFLSVYRGKDKVDFIPTFAWEKLANKAVEFHYGQEVCLKGKIRSRRYLSKGEYRERIEVYIYDMM